MKKGLIGILSVFMAIGMLFGLTACGGPSEEQLKKMDESMVAYEKIVSDAKAEMATLSAYAEKIEGFQDTYNQLKNLMTQIESQAQELRSVYDENRDAYTPEQADQLISSVDTQIANGNTFLTNLKDTVTAAKQAFDAAEQQ